MNHTEITFPTSNNTLVRLHALSHATGREVEDLVEEFVLRGLSDAEDGDEMEQVFLAGL